MSETGSDDGDRRPERPRGDGPPPRRDGPRSEGGFRGDGPRGEGPRGDGPGGDGPRGFGGPRGPRGPRDRRDGPPREMSPKARLRAKARKKARKQKKKIFQRRKVCRFCADKKLPLSYKEPKTLRLFVSETGKVIPRRISGNCGRHQRALDVEIKRARQLAYLPYAPSHY